MDLLHAALGKDPVAGLMVILSLIVIEGVLSVDNAAVLATMVMKLPRNQRAKALRYGIFGAYLFRGICLVLASWLMKFWILEPLGGLYLLWLAWDHFTKKPEPEEVDENAPPPGNAIFQKIQKAIGPFWATVIAVEIMDLAFSIDNVVAAVAYVKNFEEPTKLILVCTGVFLGILTMRFAAQGFVKLMERYPYLDNCAFAVIGLLGVKLMLAIPRHFLPDGQMIREFLESKTFDLSTSVLTLLIFIVPIMIKGRQKRIS
jgi:YkoY family integral membrane protein